MGLNKRKKSGNYIGGSRLVVGGQNIFNVKKFELTLNKQIITKESVREIPPTTTTTTTIAPVTTCYIETQVFDDMVTQGFDKLVWC